MIAAFFLALPYFLEGHHATVVGFQLAPSNAKPITVRQKQHPNQIPSTLAATSSLEDKQDNHDEANASRRQIIQISALGGIASRKGAACEGAN
jgi:hypothetical protein